MNCGFMFMNLKIVTGLRSNDRSIFATILIEKSDITLSRHKQLTTNLTGLTKNLARKSL